jgi:hypothetical protein
MPCKDKLKAGVMLDRLKARLVAKSYHQVDGVSYFKAFSPIIKPGTIRLVISLTLIRQWEIYQLDIKNAFLHGNITESIYII